MDKYQRAVAGHFMSEYSTKSWQTLLKQVAENSDKVLVWQPFENFPGEDVADWMEDMESSLRQQFPEPTKKAKVKRT